MRVCVDVLPLLVRSAGVKNYPYYWVSHLERLAGSASICLFHELNGLGPLDHEKSVAGPVRSALGLASLALINYAALPLHDWFGRGADIFHSTNLIRVPPSRMRLTTTVHDVTSWILPELHSSANRRATLAEKLRQAPLPVSTTVRYALQLVDSLRQAHDRNVITGELDPVSGVNY